MPRYHVYVSYRNLDIDDMDLVEAILEFADYIHFGAVDSRVRAQAFMEATSAEQAVATLVEDVHRAAPTAEPIAADLSLVSVSEIAADLDLNRETVRLWTTGQRGPGDFPAPVDVVGDRIKVWAASDVWLWLDANGIPQHDARPLSIEEAVRATHVISRIKQRWTQRRTAAADCRWRNVASQATTVPVRGTARRAAA